MAVEGKEILPLAFWIFTLGVSIYVTSKIIGKVSEKIHTVFQ